jgi:hypothetical protein
MASSTPVDLQKRFLDSIKRPDTPSDSGPKENTVPIEITIHRKNFADFIREFKLAPKDARDYQGKITFIEHCEQPRTNLWNAWLASRGFAGLAAPVFKGKHAVLLQRPAQTPGLEPARRSKLTAAWAAAMFPHLDRLVEGARMELIEGQGHGVALAPRSQNAHAQVLAVAEAFGLTVKRGLVVQGGYIRGTLSAAGGAIGAFEEARCALAGAATSLMGEDVLVAQVPGQGTCVIYLALETLRARGYDPAGLPDCIGDYAIRWKWDSGESLAVAKPGDMWAAIASNARREAIARRLAAAKAAAVAASAVSGGAAGTAVAVAARPASQPSGGAEGARAGTGE